MNIQLYCPDCGKKLQPLCYQSLDPSIDSCVFMNCTGRCLDDWCRDNGYKPEEVKVGIPKHGHSAATISQFVAHRSDEGRSLPWLEAEHKTCQTTMLDTIRDISKYLHESGNRKYGETSVQIENALTDITVLNAAAGMDKSYVCGFLDALAMIK